MICNRATDGGARQGPIIHVLPLHRERGKVPGWSTRNPRAVGIALLMTTHTVQAGYTESFRTAHDVREMPVTIVALLRIVGCGVTVDAARRDEYGVDLIPRCESGGCVYAIRFCGKRNSYRKQRQHENRRKQSYRREHSIPLLSGLDSISGKLLGVFVNYHAEPSKVI